MTEEWKIPRKDTLLSRFPLWASGVWYSWGTSGMRVVHMPVTWPLGEGAGVFIHFFQSLVQSCWGRDGRQCTPLAKESFYAKKSWQFKVELVDYSALKWKSSKWYRWGTDSIYHIPLSSEKNNNKAIFLLRKKKVLAEKKLLIPISNRYVYFCLYMFPHLEGFYFPYKFYLKDENMYFLNYDQWNNSGSMKYRQIFWGKSFPK